MNLYILRHGIAVDLGPEHPGPDSTRPLTAKGQKKMGRIAKAMKSMELSFDVILSSPYLRAKQTAEIVAAELGAQAKLVLGDELVAEQNPSSVIKRLVKHHLQQENVLLVGHEPCLSALISELISGRPDLNIQMKKGGLCKLSVAALEQCSKAPLATLEWLLTPKQLAAMAS